LLDERAAFGLLPAFALIVLAAVLDRSGYLTELRASDDPQDASRVENLAELHAVATEFSRDEPEGSLGDFLERVSLVADSDQIPAADPDNANTDSYGANNDGANSDGANSDGANNDGANSDGANNDGANNDDMDGASARVIDQGVVTLMTLHTAKGLEFPVVFLTGMEDGTFPHMRSMADEAELAEERRLAYVGLTRARERLYVSRADQRSAWGSSMQMPPSRFLADVPEELWDWRRSESSTSYLRGGGSAWGDSSRSGGSGWRSGGGGWSGAPGGRSGGAVGLSGPRSPRTGTSGTRTSGTGTSGTRTSGAGASGTRTAETSASFGSATPRTDIPVLAVGDRVTHDAFGLGKVVEVEGLGQNAVAKVDFGSAGTKRLLLRFAPLAKL
jgi:DNA helicase-2/ATP-dependent DNA helicase PcrA